MSKATSDGNSKAQTKEATKQSVFDERKALVGKWFDKWSATQRLTVIEDLIQVCRRHQLQRISDAICRQKLAPVRDDFTYCLPRHLSLCVFSYLDPRSLCRCAQVSWQWKSLVDSDELWTVLCQRLGWTLKRPVSPFDRSAWKRHYIDNIVSLKRTLAPQVQGIERLAISERPPTPVRQRGAKSGPVSVSDQRPPWKGSDPTPRDIWRHNYLENEDDTDKMIRVKRTSADEQRLQQQRQRHHRHHQQQQQSALMSSFTAKTMNY